jgi:hypothetical protein
MMRIFGSRIRLVGVAGALTLGTGILILGTGAQAVTTATSCSVDRMAVEYGLSLDPVSSAARAAGQIAASIAADPRYGPIVSQQVANIRSQRLSVVDGRVAVVALLSGGPARGIGGPVGLQSGLAQTTCAMTIYDANTGEFLATVEDLAVVP